MGERRRRAFLQGAGALACLGLGGSLTRPATEEAHQRPVADRPVPSTPSTGPSEERRDDFVWLAPGLWRDERLRENLVAFAARQDLAVVFSQPTVTDGEAVDRVLDAMARTREAGATPWLETAVPERHTPKQLVTDATARERHLDALREAARRYAAIVPDGNLLLWEEAPVGGRWIASGKWNGAAVDALREYGPALYAHQRAAVAEAAPDLAAGVFLHFPYVVESRQPGVFAGLMDDLAARDALPDFVFTDFYRGWYEKDVGPGPANAAVRSLVTNAARHSRGRPVYFLGQAHTVNPRHTSSTQSMRMDLRAALDAGASGVGWYARTVYKQTRRGFDAFVPNVPAESTVPEGILANTLTVARDRFHYPYRATLAARADVDTTTRFDLWVHADAPGFLGHRVSVRGGDGWVPLGDIAGAHPAVAPVEDDEHVSVFHALDGAALVADGDLTVRVETRPDADGRLLGVYALPFDPGVAYTERAATALVGRGRVRPFALGATTESGVLRPGGVLERTLPMAVADRLRSGAVHRRVPPVADLLAPGTLTHRRRLATVEAGERFDRDARFDCWLRTDGVTDADALFEDLGVGGEVVTAAAGDGAAVFWGLRRSVLGDDASGTLADCLGEFDAGTVEAAYAMPYFGSEDLRLPAHVGSLLRDSSAAAATYAFAHAEE
ncbi:hypothetical protein [Halomarina rubra]|uniref:Glycoside hydrolase family 42 N-terminal domain-containing protein n=1 Tax=Halomarina rubra TaxID=2071873 RepID=A0ABD6ATH8_9EURY|nr:hypothetical protein [Halomarina rubra]